MSELNIYEDSGLTLPVDRILYEGRTYYVRLPDVTNQTIKAEISKAELDRHIDWLEGNRVASLQIINRVGFIRFFGYVFDVRSEKLSVNATGKQQFEHLLTDLVRLSRQIIFDYSSPTSSHREADNEIFFPEILERFGYYRQLILDFPSASNLDSLIEAVLRNPHSRLAAVQTKEAIWNIKRPSSKLAKAFSENPRYLWRVNVTNSFAANEPYKTQLAEGKAVYLPSRAWTSRGTTSFDTPENRFVKHVLLDIESVCVSINSIVMPENIQRASQEMLMKSRRWLRNDFFKILGTLQFLPTTSPALTSRFGYKEIFGHFLKSRVAAKQIFNDLKRQSLYVELKDVAQLYEYWVFYKIATSLLGEKALVTARGLVTKNGRIANSISLENGNISVAFNESFVRSNRGSYSLTLRPDVVVRIRTRAGTLVILFDAKYRSRVAGSFEDELLGEVVHRRSVKPDDLYKMHCYVDAIGDAVSAMAVYPGNDFLFFHRDDAVGLINDASKLHSLNGVGAVPLLPDNAESSSFEKVMAMLKTLAAVSD